MQGTSATVPLFIPLAVTYARTEGLDVDGLAKDIGLSPEFLESRHGTEADLPRLNVLVDAIAEKLGDFFFGIHVAVRYRRGSYQLVEFACRNSPDLRGALQRLSRYAVLINPAAAFSFTETETTGALLHRFAGLGRHANEFSIALIYLLGREITRQDWTPEAVWFVHEEPSDISELTALFGTKRIRFGEDSNGLLAGRKILDASITGADPALLQVLETEMDRHTPPQPASTSSQIVADAERSVRLMLELGPPRIEQVAQSLGLSVRTLQRRLVEEGTSFQALVEGTRERLATLLAQRGELSSTQMAFILGYADVTSFLRAFKRWTGTSPQEFRGGKRVRTTKKTE